MYDSTCKFIAAKFGSDLAKWLLGKEMELTELKPSELSLEPIRADSLIFLESSALILHKEFQTDPDEDIPFRMADYRLRLYRRYPNKKVHQVVIYLRQTGSALVNQEVFELPGTRHEFRVIRLWEVPYQPLLDSPGLFPFAVLSIETNREMVLGEVARRIEEIGDRTNKNNIAASTAILAGLVLNKNTVSKLLREDIMKESVVYQDILSKGEQKEAIKLILRLLNRRLGELAPNIISQVRGLSVEQLEELGEALLDFQTEKDLEKWLKESV